MLARIDAKGENKQDVILSDQAVTVRDGREEPQLQRSQQNQQNRRRNKRHYLLARGGKHNHRLVVLPMYCSRDNRSCHTQQSVVKVRVLESLQVDFEWNRSALVAKQNT